MGQKFTTLEKSTQPKFFENFEHPFVSHYLETSQPNPPTLTVTLPTFWQSDAE